MVAEARAIRRRMLEDAERRRGALVTELARVRAEIDAAIAALTRVAEPDARGPNAATHSDPTDGGEHEPARVGALFDALRADAPSPAPSPPPPKPAAPAAATEPSPVEADPPAVDDAPRVPAAPPAAQTPADRIRRRRDALLEPLVPEVVRVSKRLLQDEQNSLLDAARRAADATIPHVSCPNTCASATRGRPSSRRRSTPPTSAVAPRRERQDASRARRGVSWSSSPRSWSHRCASVSSPPSRASSARARTSRRTSCNERSDPRSERGTASGARSISSAMWRTCSRPPTPVACTTRPRPLAMLEWVPADPGRCPDCDDNALEPTLKGKAFPTGQQHPPAHPGCRCLVVPMEA